MAPFEEERICRYCFEGETVSKLISPCDCKGSAAFIHKRCVIRWMFHSKSTNCELCQAEFRCKPSRWETFKRSMLKTKQELICYSIIFAIFMLPVILFKCIADALRHTKVLTYDGADRLLTGGLFGTYLLLIVFGLLFVAIWIHHCHDDPEADADVAPIEMPVAQLPVDASTGDHPEVARESVTEVEVVEREGDLVEVIVHIPATPTSAGNSQETAASVGTSNFATSTTQTPAETPRSDLPHGAAPTLFLAAFHGHDDNPASTPRSRAPSADPAAASHQTVERNFLLDVGAQQVAVMGVFA